MKKLFLISILLTGILLTNGCLNGLIGEEQDIKIVHQVPLGPTSKIVYSQSINATELNKIIQGIGNRDYILSGREFAVLFEININKINHDLHNVSLKFLPKSNLILDSYLFSKSGTPLESRGNGIYWYSSDVYLGDSSTFILKGIAGELEEGTPFSGADFEIQLLENGFPVIETVKTHTIKVCKNDSCQSQTPSPIPQ